MTRSSSVLTERHDNVLQITLNRPESRNAINFDLARALREALDTFEADSRLAAAVIHGAGSCFCAGADLKSPLVDGIRIREQLRVLEFGTAKPVVAAIEGYALGGGLELALVCDMMICAGDAQLGLPEVRRGLIASEGLVRLARRVPAPFVKALALTGEAMPAEAFVRVGLVHQLVDTGGAFAAGLRCAARIAANAPVAVNAARSIIDGAANMPLAEARLLQDRHRQAVFASDDANEGRLAFQQGREPIWRGR